MCGRFVSRDQAAIERYFNVTTHQFRLFDRFNVAPTTVVPVVRMIDGERILSGMHWGLIPAWSKDRKIAYHTINARAETVATKPAYRAAYKARRCLMPVSGFYEWRRDVRPKQPYYFERADQAPLTFAGLWETWKSANETVESCCLITTAANDLMSEIHNRMPVILDPDDFDWWMTGDVKEVGQLLKACPSE